MLSIIISSYQPQYYDALVKNIQATIGHEFVYEIIQIWNPNLMSITKAYQMGTEKAKYKNLLFLHEDILFYTENWGEKLLKHLQLSKVGIVGIAGSSYVPFAPSSWTVSEEHNWLNVLQGNKIDDSSKHFKTTKENCTKVFAVDGVFMAITNEHYSKIKFDERLPGFHGYDLDFSLRSSQIYENIVVDDILLKHFSQGNLDQKWLDANINLKMKQKGNFQQTNNSEVEKNVFLSFLFRYFSFYRVNFKNIIFTLRFFPFTRINFNGKKEIFKKYFHYISYSKDLNKKHK